MNIYLLRHGETNVNRFCTCQSEVDKNLNEHGKEQAEFLGRRIRDYDIDIIYVSDLNRTAETAEIVNKQVMADIIYREELREINMGLWETLNYDERYKVSGEYAYEFDKHLVDMPYPEGESGEDVIRRANKLIEEIKDKEFENVAFITSGGTIAILLSYFLGMEQHKRFNMEIDNCSISLLNYDRLNNRFKVKRINDTAHLELKKIK